MNVTSKRLLSLDAFRGLCMLGMLLVDYPGDWGYKYAPLIHAHWNGFTLADVIFPSFLFIVGVAMTFSLAKRKERGDSHSDIMKKVFKRAFILIALGLISNAVIESGPILDWKSLRLMGVLQRIAIVYVICSYLYLKFDIKKIAWIGAGILVAYWGIITLIPVPGYGMPDINIHPSESIANLSAWLDNAVLGTHISEWTKPFDNEGIISTIPAIVTGILGLLVGNFLKSDKDEASKTSWIFVSGGALLMAGQIWDIWFPINKLLWSSSFVLYSGGWSLMILAAFYWVIDAKGFKGWSKPFQALGKNAVLVFTAALCFQGAYWKIMVNVGGQEMPFRSLLYSSIFEPMFADPYKTSIMYTFAVILFWYGVSAFLDRKKIYLRA